MKQGKLPHYSVLFQPFCSVEHNFSNVFHLFRKRNSRLIERISRIFLCIPPENARLIKDQPIIQSNQTKF